MNFAQIKDIQLQDESFDTSLFLTFDLDWCCDDILMDSINLVENSGVKATWFVTHDTPLLSRLRENPKFELAIHPNFNNLLNGDSSNGKNAEEVIDRLLKIVPEAKSVRSHSMTQSSKLLELFYSKGLTHDCNHFIPEQANIKLQPWALWNGLIRVPYFWEDDLNVLYEKTTPLLQLLKRKGLKVFDFHPIHVFLNTEHLNRYNATREIHHASLELKKHRYKKAGVRTHLKTFLTIE